MAEAPLIFIELGDDNTKFPLKRVGSHLNGWISSGIALFATRPLCAVPAEPQAFADAVTQWSAD